MEGIEIVLVKKGGSAPGSTTNVYHDKNAEQAKGYIIMGSSNVNAKQLVNYYNSYKGSGTYDKYTGSNSKYNGTLSSGGAATIEKFCQIFLEECQVEGVKAEVAFAQAMHETGFLKFGGDVLPNQYNFAGLGATGNGANGNSFKDVRTGIRAQVQHLKCYASTEPLNQAKVDPRWSDSLRGKAPTVEKLQGTWATSNTYASSLMTGINRILKS
ncbi:glucosaminidase domain-containing protein [Faecalicoccus acidiformans]|uniref:Glucosaminidase domain-containing protein n=2 Tax=Faecalicoccus acidiformans TaxID=915173 RepID=A0ABS2FQ24_9FIRM|nr:glucosaminidase domain-containing protein [Faecalicoccus acidiformans]